MPISIINGRPSFTSLALREMGGFTWSNKLQGTGAKGFEGWGSDFVALDKSVYLPGPNGLTSLEKVSGMRRLPGSISKLGIASSAFRTGTGALNIAGGISEGYKEHGMLGAAWGGATWALSEYATSGIIGVAAAEGVGLTGQLGMGLGGGIGMMLTGGSPLGNIAGTWIAAQVIEGTLASTAVAAAAPVALGAFAAAGAAYMAGRGTYSLLQTGYDYRQKQLRSINTAGSTAAFMNKNAFTMRSRAIETIRNSQLNARSAFGQEAQRIHMQASGRKFNNSGLI